MTAAGTQDTKILNHMVIISIFTKDNNPLHIKECYKNKESIYDIAEALNESIYVKGDEWTVNGEKLMCPIGNKIYVL